MAQQSFLLRFLVGLLAGLALGAGSWGLLAGYPAHTPTWRPAFMVLAALVVGFAIITWYFRLAVGLGAVIGAAFGVMPGFIPWAQEHASGLWATQAIIALGGVIMVGIIVAVIVQAVDIARHGTRARDLSAQLDLPEITARRRRPSNEP